LLATVREKEEAADPEAAEGSGKVAMEAKESHCFREKQAAP